MLEEFDRGVQTIEHQVLRFSIELLHHCVDVCKSLQKNVMKAQGLFWNRFGGFFEVLDCIDIFNWQWICLLAQHVLGKLEAKLTWRLSNLQMKSNPTK